ncbi:hypothetical protein [Pedobacter westerhofensis]|nr:hypothetical protein [Pedobacter westerhofensis]
MNYRLSHTITFYTFLVMMFLLRPFMSYHLSSNGVFLNEKVRLMSMFQRVVKKKDNPVSDVMEAAELSRATDAEIILPVIFLALIRRQIAWLFSLLGAVSVNWKMNTIFMVCPSNQYFQFISRLQI